MYHRENGDLEFLKLLAAAVQECRGSAVLLLTASAGALACFTRFVYFVPGLDDDDRALSRGCKHVHYVQHVPQQECSEHGHCMRSATLCADLLGKFGPGKKGVKGAFLLVGARFVLSEQIRPPRPCRSTQSPLCAMAVIVFSTCLSCSNGRNMARTLAKMGSADLNAQRP